MRAVGCCKKRCSGAMLATVAARVHHFEPYVVPRHIVATSAVNSARDVALQRGGQFQEKDNLVMILTSTRNFLLLCAIGLAATPASARTLNKAAEISNPSISEAQFTDMSARRRHHVARRAVHRKARMVRLLRLQPAMIDRHGVAANSHVAGNSYAAATPSGAISDVGGTGVVSEARRATSAATRPGVAHCGAVIS